MLYNSVKKYNSKTNRPYLGISKAKPVHWILLVLCVLLYMLLNLLLIKLSYHDEFVQLINVQLKKSTLSGIVAQGQVIAIILITLNPIKRSNWVAIFLCSFTGLTALLRVVIKGYIDALPGAIIAIITVCISIIISSYGKNLNSQIHRVLEYSRIVKRNEVMLHNLAFYDTLTGLPNRKMIMDEIELLTDPALPNTKDFKLVYLDLDNFKKINDTMGHYVGDIILKQAALRWKKQCHKEDLLGRVGGDEFIIIIRHKASSVQLMEYLNGFCMALTDAIIIDHKDFYISASFGVTKYPEDALNADELLRNADIALYKAKNLGKNDIQFFDKNMKDEITKRIQIEIGLQSAIKKNELYMVFQPQYVSASRKLRGYEALIRWKHSEIGMISPSEFIPIAEETGIIIEIGKWIIETVLNQFIRFQKKLNTKAVISINISVIQMIEPSFVSMVKEILKKTGFDSNYLEFEITESVFIAYPDKVIQVINQLKEMGIRIALDDFGTGYASLNYLQMLPINILKIDKVFIDQINSIHPKNQMTGAIISLSHQLGIEVIAEGVELEEQLSNLVDNECDYVQGYLLGKPMDEKQILERCNLAG